MRVVTHDDAVTFIREHGGALYVWADLMRCAGPRCSFFTASTDPPEPSHDFRRYGGGGFELFFSDEGLEPPLELRIELSGRRKKRISAYEGYTWVLEE
jgi:hypothetical protein